MSSYSVARAQRSLQRVPYSLRGLGQHPRRTCGWEDPRPLPAAVELS